MPTRRMTVGGVPLGGGAPVSIQSMTNTDTRDTRRTLAQIRALAEAGADIVRVSVYDDACAAAVRDLVDGSPVPLVADIHFDHALAIKSIENGIAKVRLNPGNIGGADNVRAVADCARMHHVPIRVGVNSGSMEKRFLDRDGGVTARGMVDSALSHAKLLEDARFHDIVLSLKSTDARETIEAYRLASRACDYPLHVGMTEAGLPGRGTVASAVVIGTLLYDGIGDTVRVSLTGDPTEEPKAAISILRALGMRKGIRFISCPTCGRTSIDVAGIAKHLEDEFADEKADITVAVMGCVVNGPGEARHADLALCGGKDAGALYIGGRYVKSLRGDLAALMAREVRSYLDERR